MHKVPLELVVEVGREDVDVLPVLLVQPVLQQPVHVEVHDGVVQVLAGAEGLVVVLVQPGQVTVKKE